MVRQPPGFGFGRTGRRMDRKMFRQGTFLLQVCLSAGSSPSLASADFEFVVVRMIVFRGALAGCWECHTVVLSDDVLDLCTFLFKLDGQSVTCCQQCSEQCIQNRHGHVGR